MHRDSYKQINVWLSYGVGRWLFHTEYLQRKMGGEKIIKLVEPRGESECGERPKGDRRFDATQGKAQPAAGVPGAAFKQPGTSLHQSG